MAIDRWTLVRTDPDEVSLPEQLCDRWGSGIELARPAPVATVADVDDTDDHDWWHRTVVDVDEPATVEFAGLTFPAAVYVDGVEVAQGRSMFLPVNIELAAGSHEICVCFRSMNRWLKTRRPRGRWRSSLVAAAGLRWARTTLLGRAPVYGNIPVPVGFWRPVTISPKRLAVRLRIDADAANGEVCVTGRLACDEARHVAVIVTGPGGDTVANADCQSRDGGFDVRFGIADRALWWPRGYGAQHLYHAVVRVDGQVAAERLFGFRTVTADTADDGFTLRVNGVPVFCRGATWSPPDAVGLTVGDTTMRDHVDGFAAAGANMVRIVGGVVTEQPEFWNSCARLGLLVWQDAMLATFDPPAEIAPVVVEEMTELLDAVSGNPALAVVSGGSETLQRPEMLGLPSGSFAMDVIDTALPEVVASHGHVPYVRASPAPAQAGDDFAIRPDTGVAHWFGVGGYLRPVDDVKSAGVRFAAECLAFANPPVSETIEAHFGSLAVAGHDPKWKQAVPRDRGASWDFEDVRDFYVREVFGEDPFAVRRVDPERYLQLGRLAIAHAMTECFSFWRRTDSRCSGAIVLAGKDLCAGPGWGLMDVDGKPKPAMTALARVWAPVAVIVTNAGLAGIRVDVYNDLPAAVEGELELLAVDASGLRTVEAKQSISVPARSASTFFDTTLSEVFRDLSHSFRFGPAPADGIEVVFRRSDSDHPLRDVLIVNPRPRQVRSGIRATATRCGDDWHLSVAADTALRYVEVKAPGWVASDNYFHLLAGSPHTVSLKPIAVAADEHLPKGTASSVDCLDVAQIELT